MSGGKDGYSVSKCANFHSQYRERAKAEDRQARLSLCLKHLHRHALLNQISRPSFFYSSWLDLCFGTRLPDINSLFCNLTHTSTTTLLSYMATTPVPSPRETWEEIDFDLPDNDLADDAEDWDAEMKLGKTGGVKVNALIPGITIRSRSTFDTHGADAFVIRPPKQLQTLEIDDDDDDEGVSTIKVTSLPKPTFKVKEPPPVIEEDFEGDFALPSDMTQLSLAPLSLNHRSSRYSLEWGDNHTSSSQSSDAYSTLGFADASPSSNSASSTLPDTEDDEDDEDVLDGLVIPPSLFESKQGGRQLNTILDLKKKAQYTGLPSKIAKPDPEDDFEIGLLIEDDVDLSPSRLMNTCQQQQRMQQATSRSKTLPPQRLPSLRPVTRIKSDRAKSPLNPPPSASARQLEKLRLSPSPPLLQSRLQTFQSLIVLPITAPPTSVLSAKPGSLRGQKSHSGFKPPTPPGSLRRVARKTSLSSLSESNNPEDSCSSISAAPRTARYEEPTAASRAKAHKNSTSRMHGPEFKVPPTRPTTPSANPTALRLTMPTQSRLKSRPTINGLFSAVQVASSSNAPSPISRAASTSPQPILPRPPSAASLRSIRNTIQTSNSRQPTAPKILRKPKRPQTYGDGTELDAIDDLPTNREQEARFHVQPKGFGNRISGATPVIPPMDKDSGKVTIRRKSKLEISGATSGKSLSSLMQAKK